MLRFPPLLLMRIRLPAKWTDVQDKAAKQRFCQNS